jgi:hypothetical protein
MKTLQEILKQDPVYLHDWSSKSEVAASFADGYTDEEIRAFEKSIEYANILFASYTYQDYSGDAFVLYESGGKLFEVNGGHCSCYGLEGQWDSTEVTLPEMEHRLTKGDFGFGEYKKELMDFLGIKEASTHE